jgi:hypothetical protein
MQKKAKQSVVIDAVDGSGWKISVIIYGIRAEPEKTQKWHVRKYR